MGFFDEFTRPPPELSEEDLDQPEWSDRPRGWLGGTVALELLVARSDDAAVYVTSISAYPVGFAFSLHAYIRHGTRAHGVLAAMASHDPWGSDEPADLLRHGLEFSDGRKASTFHEWDAGGTYATMGAVAGEAPGPDPGKVAVLSVRGGHGSMVHAEEECWVWPLPPPVPLAFVCEWPELGISESRAEIQAELIREAAQRATEIWPDS
jgi:hypothetical protein